MKLVERSELLKNYVLHFPCSVIRTKVDTDFFFLSLPDVCRFLMPDFFLLRVYHFGDTGRLVWNLLKKSYRDLCSMCVFKAIKTIRYNFPKKGEGQTIMVYSLKRRNKSPPGFVTELQLVSRIFFFF